MDQLQYLLSEPSAENWDAICTRLDAVTNSAELKTKVTFCKKGLEHWPDELRVAPERWRAGNSCMVLARIRKLFAFEKTELDSFGIPNPNWPAIRALAHHPSRPEVVLCIYSPERMYLVKVNLQNGSWKIIYEGQESREDECSMRCERIEYLQGGESLLVCWNSDSTSAPTHGEITLLRDGHPAISIKDPVGYVNPDEGLSLVAACYDDKTSRLYYAFMGEGKLHARKLEGKHENLGSPVEEIRTILARKGEELILGLDGAEFAGFDPQTGLIKRNMYHRTVDFPAVRAGISEDEQTFCSIHPFDHTWYDREFEDLDRWGGIYFWDWGDTGNFKCISRHPFQFDIWGSGGTYSVFRPMNVQGKLMIAVAENRFGHPACVKIIGQNGLYRSIELHQIKTSICINAFDSSGPILIAEGDTVYEWMPD